MNIVINHNKGKTSKFKSIVEEIINAVNYKRLDFQV